MGNGIEHGNAFIGAEPKVMIIIGNNGINGIIGQSIIGGKGMRSAGRLVKLYRPLPVVPIHRYSGLKGR